jgi:ABC-type dipeptide/oligopeptide/nickel transport systems, permease components
MFRYLIRRVLWAIMLFVVITMVTFVIFFMIPVHPAQQACGQRATPTCIKLATTRLGLDKPIYVQYVKFMDRLVIHHNLGKSFVTRQSVNTLVLNAAPVTASLVFGGAFFWMLIALPVGILSALKPRSLLDRVSMVFVLIGISAHPIWIGLIFSYFFGFKMGWFPITGYCDFFNPSTDCGGPVQWAWHMCLPWATFAILFAALYVRMIRANVMEASNEDYVRTARAKGAPEWIVIRSHILRNALLPVVTMLGMDIGVALGGAIFTETVYSLPGLGLTGLQSIQSFDLPVTQGIIVFATFAIIVFNLVVDLLYAVIDPRIRLS